MDFIQNKSVKIIVSGRVQGVGYRYFIARFAASLELTGYAKNHFNGDVEIMAEGRQEFLEGLIEKAKSGPGGAYVKTCKTEWLDFKKKYDKFEIL